MCIWLIFFGSLLAHAKVPPSLYTFTALHVDVRLHVPTWLWAHLANFDSAIPPSLYIFTVLHGCMAAHGLPGFTCGCPV